MKKYLKFFLIVILIWGCRSKDIGPQGEFEIAANQAKVFDNLTIELLAGQDSRCNLVNGICIWEGYATAKVAVKSNVSSQKQEIEFCLGGCSQMNLKDTQIATFNLDNKMYVLTLVEIIRKNGEASTIPVTVKLKLG